VCVCSFNLNTSLHETRFWHHHRPGKLNGFVVLAIICNTRRVLGCKRSDMTEPMETCENELYCIRMRVGNREHGSFFYSCRVVVYLCIRTKVQILESLTSAKTSVDTKHPNSVSGVIEYRIYASPSGHMSTSRMGMLGCYDL
jgi:hypothetical protein